MAIHANSRRTPSGRPPSRPRRPIPAVLVSPLDDAPTTHDVLMALPPQTRRAIVNRRSLAL